MYINELSAILISVAPAVVSAATIIACMVKVFSLFKKQKKQSEIDLKKSEEKVLKVQDDIALIKTKIASMENYLCEHKENVKRGIKK